VPVVHFARSVEGQSDSLSAVLSERISTAIGALGNCGRGITRVPLRLGCLPGSWQTRVPSEDAARGGPNAIPPLAASSHRDRSSIWLAPDTTDDRVRIAGASANFDRTPQLRNQRSVSAGPGTRGAALRAGALVDRPSAALAGDRDSQGLGRRCAGADRTICAQPEREASLTLAQLVLLGARGYCARRDSARAESGYDPRGPGGDPGSRSPIDVRAREPSCSRPGRSLRVCSEARDQQP
jgi:hypothetical protein